MTTKAAKPGQQVVVLTAPSGAGKTSVARQLLKAMPGLDFSVSATTRAARDNEKHGVHYYFLSPREFREKIDAGEFLEFVEVYEGQYYGSLLSEVERLNRMGKTALFDIDVNGAQNIKNYFGKQSLVIFVAPPSREVLRKRLLQRNTETPESFSKRMERVDYELSFADSFDHCVVNDELEQTVEEVSKLVQNFLKHGYGEYQNPDH